MPEANREAPTGRQISSSLQSAGEPISTAEAEEISLVHYGLSGTATKLSGEKDSNFRLCVKDGREFLLKVVNPGEEPGVTDLHTAALLHVAAADPSLPVQRIVPSLDGRPDLRLVFPGDGERAVRMVTFTKGVLQRETIATVEQLRNVGRTLARLQLALKDFVHPSADHELTWDLKQASSLRRLLPAIDKSDRRARLENRLSRFENDILPTLLQLRSQVVHNDLNSDNVLVDSTNSAEVVGVLDFGDMVRTAVVADVAVGAAYQLSDGAAPLQSALDFVAGFNSVRPLEDVELDLFYDLVVTRMVTRLAITEWRASLFPENREYILRNTPRAWTQFDRLCLLSREQATAQICEACKL